MLRIALLSSLGLLLLPTTDASSAPAASSSAAMPARGALDLPPSPKAASKAKRAKWINAALTKRGYPKLEEPPPQVDGLTPMRPELPDGAAIVIGSQISFF